MIACGGMPAAMDASVRHACGTEMPAALCLRRLYCAIAVARRPIQPNSWYT